jgi:hypothetical protein
MACRRAGAIVALFVLCLAALRQTALARHRYNLHEPLFADDDDDTEARGSAAADFHTVTAGANHHRQQPAAGAGGSSTSSAPAASRSGASSIAPQLAPIRGLPPLVATFATNTPGQMQTVVRNSNELKRSTSTTAKRQASPAVAPQDAPIVQQQRNAGGSQPKHWSALRNYYDKLRPAVWEEARPRQPIVIASDSQQKLLDDFQLQPLAAQQGQLQLQQQQQQQQQQPKQVYTIDQVKYPLATNLKSPFELPQAQGGLQHQPQAQPQYVPPECRAFQTAALRAGDPFEQQVVQQQPIVDWALELPTLPDKIFFNQQQVRARHQQDTFGSMVDRGIQEQLQLDEMNCGPRNLVRNLMAAASRRQQPGLGFGEYPSHAGLYNASQASDQNFVCSATLVHSRFALTLASCLSNLTTDNLFVRTGDWAANRKLNDSERRLVMLVNKVVRVHPFPRYQPGSEHDLALLEWSKPIEFAAAEYISPACQAHSRSSLRMRSCWAPVRNITVSAYFDADGEGETKLRQDVQMVEVPISLISSDDTECRRQTSMESFSFQHPNYICSADFRQPQWRAKLKQSQFLGSGVYCDEGGLMSLVSIMHPLQTNTTADYGYLDLSYYRPWMRNIIMNQAGFIKYHTR